MAISLGIYPTFSDKPLLNPPSLVEATGQRHGDLRGWLAKNHRRRPGTLARRFLENLGLVGGDWNMAGL